MTLENVNEYIAEVLNAIIGKGVVIQVKAFREGFSKVFPITDLKAFSADELVMLFGNSDEDWSIESMWSRHRIYSRSLIFYSSLRGVEGRPWFQCRE